jgi:hypothetical protein
MCFSRRANILAVPKANLAAGLAIASFFEEEEKT